MPRRKRRTKKQPKPPSEPVAKIKKRRRRRRKVVAETVPVMAEPKTLMQRIFESQRSELDSLSDTIKRAIG
jgi:hypothetical protein